ncbi:cytochrome c [Mesobacterium sp. TK19101]|uniref:Cytochrome c n=1 Tax=Mesobacterium hydrothermale TaxID=3111907 RepID=A0ABU6HET2_9RHOB|nr:cytochrome c [Mesobacterium sp. TK19101]MEC3860974.1 cytochrome c [Mesobacterium sp. TK19101]
MKKTFAALAAVATLASTAAVAQDFKAPIQARQGEMRILGMNLGILGGMAKGEVPYTVEAASAAANSIVGVTMIHQATLFPAGSDEMGADGTRAKAEIWDKMDDYMAKWDALGAAAAEMQTAAATGQEAIGPALGKIGGACKSCHEAYRAPQN